MLYEEVLKSMYNDILSIMGNYHVFCISQEGCKQCPIEQVCEHLTTAEVLLTELLKS